MVGTFYKPTHKAVIVGVVLCEIHRSAIYSGILNFQPNIYLLRPINNVIPSTRVHSYVRNQLSAAIMNDSTTMKFFGFARFSQRKVIKPRFILVNIIVRKVNRGESDRQICYFGYTFPLLISEIVIWQPSSF